MKSINRSKTLEMKSTPVALSSLSFTVVIPRLFNSPSCSFFNEFWRELWVADNYRAINVAYMDFFDFYINVSHFPPHTHQYLLRRTSKKNRCLINGSQIFDLLRLHSFRVAFWLIVFVVRNERNRHSLKLLTGILQDMKNYL